MDDPFLAEIVPISFSFAPKGFAECNGQILPINQNQALFSLLGTNYGGNGQVTFALPDLRGRIPVHRQSAGLQPGARGGAEAVTLTAAQLPAHSHPLRASSGEATSSIPKGFVQARGGMYSADIDATTAAGIANAGGGQAHENMPPFLVIPFCIALQGIFPSQN